MPKFGLKCFIGSFLLSLAAAFVATKAYLIMTINEKNVPEPEIKAQNIELFAANEENDALYEKFNRINPPKINEDIAKQTDSAHEPLENTAKSDEVLYSPEEDEQKHFLENIKSDNETKYAQSEIENIAADVNIISDNQDDDASDELQIADAATAPVFSIPLVHNFSNGRNNILVSDEAQNSQIALAADDVSVNNLGISEEAAVTNDEKTDDDPWEVAQTANKHASKNLNAEKTAEIKAEPQVPYKMQKNLLIPIPEDIMNQKNLTPEFSSSAENKQLEDELRAMNKLPPKATPHTGVAPQNSSNAAKASKLSAHSDSADNIEGGDNVDNESDDEEISKSLSDSIAAWFSSSKAKTKQDSIKSNDKIKSPKGASSNKDQSNSIFSKLLGIGEQNDVTPTEMKLSFQPDRAEISGQTLEWLHAFAENAVKYENVVVEIRIDKSSPYELQQKRLRLLYRILANNGVDYNKVNIIFTDRAPNSFIIRNVRYATEEEKAKNVKPYNPWQ